MNAKNLSKILKDPNKPVITVFGDFCLDKYLYIDAARDELSVETGLTAFQVIQKKLYAGAAGTITNNLCKLGAEVYCVGILGDDGDGYELERCLKGVGAETRFMVRTDERSTCTYEKPIRCQDGSESEINRLDIRNFSKTPMIVQEKLIDNLESAIRVSQAVIICDQYDEEDFAAVTAYMRGTLERMAKQYSEVLFYADSRRYVDKFQNCIIKCNQKEIARIFKVNSETIDSNMALEYAKRLYIRNKKPVFVTLGEQGSIVFDGYPHKIPAFRVDEPMDIVGAGDAYNAAAVFALTKGASFEGAALIGNAASSIVIKQINVTGTAKLSDIITQLDGL
ncbi:MAG: PfkB domain protein [Clostridia bacterium]|jgi:rfaE bifunctional protein kinase chain/domain|nr:PfkB domain protein [Clostridia bacterium]